MYMPLDMVQLSLIFAKGPGGAESPAELPARSVAGGGGDRRGQPVRSLSGSLSGSLAKSVVGAGRVAGKVSQRG